jgi:hypothetical protein
MPPRACADAPAWTEPGSAAMFAAYLFGVVLVISLALAVGARRGVVDLRMAGGCVGGCEYGHGYADAMFLFKIGQRGGKVEGMQLSCTKDSYGRHTCHVARCTTAALRVR